MDRHKFGRVCEYIALIFYLIRGYRLVKYNYRSKLGQIDLIIRRRNLVVFAEVKGRRTEGYDDLVSYKQRRRIRTSAECFLAKTPIKNIQEIRFDVVLVKNNFWPKIITNAF